MKENFPFQVGKPASGTVSLPTDYTLPARFGDLGPRLLAAGAIDYDRFVQAFQQAGQPLTDEQAKILTAFLSGWGATRAQVAVPKQLAGTGTKQRWELRGVILLTMLLQSYYFLSK